MKVFLRISVDVWSRRGGKKQELEQVKEAVQEAIWNRLSRAGEEDFDHALREEINLLVDCVTVKDVDLIDES